MNFRTLVDRNADACEKAVHPECSCHCRGVLHGKIHSEGWRAETAQTFESLTRARALANGAMDKQTDDLFGTEDYYRERPSREASRR